MKILNYIIKGINYLFITLFTFSITAAGAVMMSAFVSRIWPDNWKLVTDIICILWGFGWGELLYNIFDRIKNK